MIKDAVIAHQGGKYNSRQKIKHFCQWSKPDVVVSLDDFAIPDSAYDFSRMDTAPSGFNFSKIIDVQPRMTSKCSFFGFLTARKKSISKGQKVYGLYQLDAMVKNGNYYVVIATHAEIPCQLATGGFSVLATVPAT
jgi:hypothetical protein